MKKNKLCMLKVVEYREQHYQTYNLISNELEQYFELGGGYGFDDDVDIRYGHSLDGGPEDGGLGDGQPQGQSQSRRPPPVLDRCVDVGRRGVQRQIVGCEGQLVVDREYL